MEQDYFNAGSRLRKENTDYNSTEATFQAFADVMIPQTLELAKQYGIVQYYGARDLYTDEYLILSLNNLMIPMAVPAAQLLDTVSQQFLYLKGEKEKRYPDRITFSQLTPDERLQTMALIIEPAGIVYYPALIEISQEDLYPILLLLIRLSMMGYCSEWSGYGTTRLNFPNQRTLEYYPVSWRQIGYPGPSKGYRIAKLYNFA